MANQENRLVRNIETANNVIMAGEALGVLATAMLGLPGISAGLAAGLVLDATSTVIAKNIYSNRKK